MRVDNSAHRHQPPGERQLYEQNGRACCQEKVAGGMVGVGRETRQSRSARFDNEWRPRCVEAGAEVPM
jgi:hypothetical protein